MAGQVRGATETMRPTLSHICDVTVNVTDGDDDDDSPFLRIMLADIPRLIFVVVVVVVVVILVVVGGSMLVTPPP